MLSKFGGLTIIVYFIGSAFTSFISDRKLTHIYLRNLFKWSPSFSQKELLNQEAAFSKSHTNNPLNDSNITDLGLEEKQPQQQ